MFISCDEAKKMIKQQNAQLVDVRTPEEFAESGIPGAKNLPLQDIDRTANTSLDKSLPIVVYCRSGQRSQMALQILMSLGFTNVHNLGSFMAWQQCPDV